LLLSVTGAARAFLLTKRIFGSYGIEQFINMIAESASVPVLSQ